MIDAPIGKHAVCRRDLAQRYTVVELPECQCGAITIGMFEDGTYEIKTELP